MRNSALNKGNSLESENSTCATQGHARPSEQQPSFCYCSLRKEVQSNVEVKRFFVSFFNQLSSVYRLSRLPTHRITTFAQYLNARSICSPVYSCYNSACCAVLGSLRCRISRCASPLFILLCYPSGRWCDMFSITFIWLKTQHHKKTYIIANESRSGQDYVALRRYLQYLNNSQSNKFISS